MNPEDSFANKVGTNSLAYFQTDGEKVFFNIIANFGNVITKKPTRCKHSSLLCDSISDKEKRFYNIGTSTLMNPEAFFANKVGTNSLAYFQTLLEKRFFSTS
jgi:hypothetical protein